MVSLQTQLGTRALPTPVICPWWGGGHWPSAPVGKAGQPWVGPTAGGQQAAQKSRAAGPLGKLDFIPSSLLDAPELPCQPLHGGELRLTDTAPARRQLRADNEDSGKAAGLSEGDGGGGR